MTEATLEHFRAVERRILTGQPAPTFADPVHPHRAMRPRGRTSKAFCGKGVVLHVDPSLSMVVQIVVRCHRYDCRTCGPARTREAQAIARSGRPERLLTLTLRRNAHAPIDRQIQLIYTSFRELVRRIRKHFPAFHYFKCLELTKAGTPHLHVLCRGDYIPVRWIRHQWQQITGAFIVYIQRIDRTSGAVHEVTKYLLKTAGQLSQIFPNLRVFSHSKDWVIDGDPRSLDKDPDRISLGFFRLDATTALERWAAYGFDISADRESPGQWTISPTGTPDLDAIDHDLGSFDYGIALLAKVALELLAPEPMSAEDLLTTIAFYRGDYDDPST